LRAISSLMPQFEVVKGGSAAVLRVRLRQGESIKAESDALVSKTAGVALAARSDGGFLSGAARSLLAGESFFLQFLTCEASSGEALLAPEEQGDISIIELGLPGAPAMELLVTAGAFLCAEAGINIDTRVQGISKALFSGGGMFLMRCSGRGRLAVACLGSCVRYDLAQGEGRQVDNGHLVSWDSLLQYTIGLATPSWYGSFASGEGMMCTFTGPGSVWLQTHKPRRDKAARNGGSSQGGILGLCVICIFMIIFIGVFGFVGYMQWGDGDSHRPHRPKRNRRHIEF